MSEFERWAAQKRAEEESLAQAAAEYRGGRPASGPRRPGPRLGIWVFLSAAGVLSLLAWAVVAMVAGPRIQEDREKQQAQSSFDQEKAQKIRRELDDMVGNGAIHSIDYESGVMRVDPLLWAPLVVEKKQTMVRSFYLYYSLRGEPRRVEVRSNRNDSVFAAENPSEDAKIHF